MILLLKVIPVCRQWYEVMYQLTNTVTATCVHFIYYGYEQRMLLTTRNFSDILFNW